MLMKQRILIIDDEPVNITLLRQILAKDQYEYEIDEALDPNVGLDYLNSNNYDLVLTDLMMPEMSGIELLRKAKQKNKDLNVIIITAHGKIEDAIEATKEGAYDFIQKPIFSKELLLKIHRALESSNLRKEIHSLKSQMLEEVDKKIITSSKTMISILQKIKMVSKTDATVLITGESGTGKDLIAQYIHYNSSRANQNLMAINCGAMPGNLLESELFGHEKGAFTGAFKAKKGLFVDATNGTLFLDEVGELDPALQVKLLRVLQDGEVRPVGGNTSIYVDVRIIAATNQDIQQMVDNKTFRQDLYYRLNVIPVHLPPLRERDQDIELLANHFLSLYSEKHNKILEGFTKEAKEKLLSHNWPGNVRELQNKIEHAVVVAGKHRITPHDLLFDEGPPSLTDTNAYSTDILSPFKEARAQFEWQYFYSLLKQTKGNVTKAAELSGLTRKNLYDFIKKHQLNMEDFRDH